MTFRTLDTNMKTPYRYDYTKIVLSQPLQSGQTVQVQVLSANGAINLSSETKSYAAANPKQELLFRKLLSGVGGTLQDKFEDYSVIVNTTGGAAVARMSVYATPLEDGTEDL